MNKNKNLSAVIRRSLITLVVAVSALVAPQATASAQNIPTPQQLSSQFNIPQPHIPTPEELAKQFNIPLPSMSSTSHPPSPQAPAPQPPAPHIATPQELLNDTNAARTRNGLPPVSYSPELTNLAQDWANHVRDEGRLYHRPQYWTQYPSYIPAGGENALQAWTDYNSPRLVQLWMDSPGHRKNILDPRAKTVGIGVATAADGKLYAIQNFGR